MAKFCTECGRPLKDGKPCEYCNKEKEEKEIIEDEEKIKVEEAEDKVSSPKKDNEEVDKVVNETKEVLSETLQIAKEYAKEPVTTIEKKTNEKHFKHAIVLLIVLALSVGVYTLTFLKESVGAAVATPSLNPFMDPTFGSIVPQVEIPYFKVFLVSSLTSASILLVVSLITWLIASKLLKSKVNFKETLVVYTMPSIILSACALIAALVNFIDLRLAGLFIFVGAILNQYYFNINASEKLKVNKNKVGYLLVSASLLTTVIFLFVLKEVLIG